MNLSSRIKGQTKEALLMLCHLLVVCMTSLVGCFYAIIVTAEIMLHVFKQAQ